MGTKLQELANQFRFHPPTMLLETLHDLDTQLNNVLLYFQTTHHSILPPKKKIAPNQHLWTETAQVMGVAVKSKWKITHTDLYSRGKRLGEKAKPYMQSIVAQHTIPNALTTVCPIAPTPMLQGTPAMSPGLTTSVPPALVPSVSTLAFLPNHVASTPTSMMTTANSHYFNKATINLHNMALL